MRNKFKPTQNKLVLITALVGAVSLAGAEPSIVLDLSVTTDTSGTGCETTTFDSVTVAPGTDVQFCALVANFGPETYETHTLNITPFGNIIEDAAFTLVPEGSANASHVETINSTTDVTANWQVPSTGYDQGLPNYDFVDISAIGTALGLGDDDAADVSMDFPFTLYGLTSQDMVIGNNGAIRFGITGDNVNFSNGVIANDIANNFIAPFWDDLDSDTGDVYYRTTGTSPNRVFTVQWHERPHYDFFGGTTTGVGSTTFQVKLFETTNVIEFHYQDVQFEEEGFDFGASATVGIGGDVRGDEFSFNTASLSDNFAISYTPVYAYALNNPTYDFVDISATGTALGLSDDGEADVSMDFPFTLYGLTSDEMTIGNNGAIRFEDSGSSVNSTNGPIENDGDNNLIAPFWDDIDSDTGDVYHETQGSAPNRVFIVQWHDRPHYSNTGSTTFQLKLFETTNVIEFHYQDVQFEDDRYDFGASATVGIGGAVHGDQYSFNTPSIADEFAISYTPVYPYTQDDTITYDFVDISTSGTALGLGLTGEGEADVSIDFPFTLYGLTSQDMTIGNNGAIRFGVSGAQVYFSNQAIENDGANNLIAPFWDDIGAGTGDVYHETQGTAPNRVFIVQWHDLPHNLGAGSSTFQVKLFETTNEIEFHYQDVQFEDDRFDFGASATVGIGGAVHGDQYSVNTAILTDELAIAYRPSSVDSASNHAMVIVDPDLIFANGFE